MRKSTTELNLYILSQPRNFPTSCRRVLAVVTVQYHKDFLVDCFAVYGNTYYPRLGLWLPIYTTLQHCQYNDWWMMYWKGFGRKHS